MSAGHEHWRPIEGWPYEVSSLGNIRRLAIGPGTHVGRVLHPAAGANGYLRVTLSDKGHYTRPKSRKPRNFHVHTLVCAAFHGPRPPGCHARHLDGDRQHNTAANLAWGTARENAADKRGHGTMLIGDRHPRTKVSEEAYRAILKAWDDHPRGYGRTGEFIEIVVAEYGVSKGFVEDAIYGRVRATRVRVEGTRL